MAPVGSYEALAAAIQAGADGHDLRPLMEASREAIASALPENER